ncbi:predicted protein [Botrytis cinerea T4]|uniref:Uncharacterized protein n=1 Tax=Botryotinia fuckeliana (strain T4) TaxID=999810 RepID=G2YDJ0_BOTF4|nr:predicted protein [Botrytis cinerea T4]
MYTCIGPSQLHASFYWIYASAGHMLLPDAHFHWTQTSLGRILSTCFVPSSRTSKARDTHRMEQIIRNLLESSTSKSHAFVNPEKVISRSFSYFPPVCYSTTMPTSHKPGLDLPWNSFHDVPSQLYP